jgi:hypothetical protein
MQDAAYELDYLKAGMGLLESYLFSQDVYWTLQTSPPGGRPAYPSLTLGGLLLAQTRLSSTRLSGELRAERDRVRPEFEAVQARWRVAWEKKAVREFHARLNLWRDYLEEYRSNPKSNADRYSYEVSRRVMLHLLQPFARDAPQAEKDMLRGLDSLLQSVFLPGGFIWEDWLESAFPAQPYWYLYGSMRDTL